MNAVAHNMDPHSSYLSPRQSEEYRIQMSLSYDGIGASLQLEDDYVKVMNIIPGGPAQIDGQLKPEDRITGVGEGGTEPVDVIGWRLDDVVSKIRGPGGTKVRLQVLPAGAQPGSPEKTIELMRDKIKLEEQAAKKQRLEIPFEGKTYKIGVITVPSFYQDFAARSRGEEDYTSTSRDVTRLLDEFKAEGGIDGLVMDLRANGGGHLSEATELSGLFIERGPIVQLRETRGTIQQLDDPSPTAIYGGPMAVLVDRYSASASEIFAAAIQDYDRGIIIGQQTFGKGFKPDPHLATEIPDLRAHQAARAAKDPDYAYLLGDVAAFKEIAAQKSVSLNMQKRVAENKKVDEGRLARENTRRAAQGLPPFAKVEELESAERPENILLRQAARVVAELAQMEGPRQRQLVSGSEGTRKPEVRPQ
jgi:C-terminal peptidase prc